MSTGANNVTNLIRAVLFYTGVAMLLTHELDAMRNHEWRVLPLTAHFDDSMGEDVFVWMHVPLFAVMIGCIASIERRIRATAQNVVAAFLMIHCGLHLAFSGHAEYEFGEVQSSVLIYGAGVLGLLFFVVGYVLSRQAPRPES